MYNCLPWQAEAAPGKWLYRMRVEQWARVEAEKDKESAVTFENAKPSDFAEESSASDDPLFEVIPPRRIRG